MPDQQNWTLSVIVSLRPSETWEGWTQEELLDVQFSASDHIETNLLETAVVEQMAAEQAARILSEAAIRRNKLQERLERLNIATK